MWDVHPSIFVVALCSPAQCAALLRRVDRQRDGEAPNSMNKYGVVLGGELKPLLARLVAHHIAPIAADEYPELQPLKKHPYAFVVDYDVKKQRSLAAHFDSSDVTLNLCLGGEFRGGAVVFYKGNKPEFEYQHDVGYAVVHRGSHIHRAKPITRGTRSNLILWCSARAA